MGCEGIEPLVTTSTFHDGGFTNRHEDHTPSVPDGIRTRDLRRDRATSTPLLCRDVNEQSPRQDSNLRSPAPRAGALTRLRHSKIPASCRPVRPVGLESTPPAWRAGGLSIDLIDASNETSESGGSRTLTVRVRAGHAAAKHLELIIHTQ